jgi:hypothetical protein
MRQVCAQLEELLQELDTLLSTLHPEVYAAESRDSSSLGRHVRHVLNHFEALRSAADGAVTYCDRERGTPVETDPAAARAVIAAAQIWVAQWATERDSSLRVTDIAGARNGEVRIECTSSRVRELCWVASHTVHHLAIIRQLLRAARVDVPLAKSADLAPSTRALDARLERAVRPLRGSPCAR